MRTTDILLSDADGTAAAAATINRILIKCVVILLFNVALNRGQGNSLVSSKFYILYNAYTTSCTYFQPGYPVTKVETVTIIKIDLQRLQDKTVTKNVVDFLTTHNFSHYDEIIQRSNKSLLRTTYSKYYQSEYVKAKEYELIRIISNDSWHSVKQAFISLVKNATENTKNGDTGKLWSMELIPPDLDAKEYTPIQLPLLGFALRVIYTRECDEIPEGCAR